jgi:hypothetical protein
VGNGDVGNGNVGNGHVGNGNVGNGHMGVHDIEHATEYGGIHSDGNVYILYSDSRSMIVVIK